MATTLREVARLAGVSVSTVSRALSGDRRRPVAPQTQERIFAAVQRLEYRPAGARVRPDAPAAGQITHTVGLLHGKAAGDRPDG